MYVPDPHQMAHIIAANSLEAVREHPNCILHDWYDGRCAAVALMYHEPELFAAANEVRFLTGDYRTRHFA